MFETCETGRYRGEEIGIATGGSSQEREISLQTGRAFAEALRGRNYEVTVYDIATDLDALVDDRPAAVLLGLHGGRGESGALQGYLETIEIPYTGSGVLASALAMDKRRTRVVCDKAGVPVADAVWCSSRRLEDPETIAREVETEIGFPVVAKLNNSGSSFGVHLCERRAALEDALERLASDVTSSASSGVLVEELIEGPEYTVGFFDDQCLGVIEIEPGDGFYDFESKYERGDTSYDIISDDSICDPLVEWAKKALDAVGCRGVARVDFKGMPSGNRDVAMLEINPIPGMTETSLVPKLAAHQGLEFPEFVEAMVATARLDGA